MALLALLASLLPCGAAAVGIDAVRQRQHPHTLHIFSSTPAALLADDRSRENRSSEGDAQFLIQATFGPTRGSLEELGQTTLQSWVRTQLQAPATAHREYYRKRVSSRLVDSPWIGSPRSRCSAGSRWHAFAFSVADKGKWVNITGNKIYVDGAHRSDIDPANSGNGLPAPDNCTNEYNSWMAQNYPSTPCSYWLSYARHVCGRAALTSSWTSSHWCRQNCFDTGNPYPGDDCSPGWVDLEMSGYLCSVEEDLGGLLKLGHTESCEVEYASGSWNLDDGLRPLLNPLIWFSSPPGDSSVTLAFQEVRPRVVTLAQSRGEEPCDLGEFVYHDGQHYLADARLELLQNDISSPSGGELNTCRAVPRTFLNEGSCQLRTACGALEVGGTQPPSTFVLNATTFEFFLNFSERYVYAVTGLVDTVSPCGRQSRWRLLECSLENCSVTSMSATDATAVASALALETGPLRDVYVSCEGVAAGAVVASGANYFLHVHSNYLNVYDFTTWVSTHPGGMEPIKRWATGPFQLEFPDWHPMGRWVYAQQYLEYIGKSGDTVAFEALPLGLQAAWTVGYESCGSPGEVANDPSLGHHFGFITDWDNSRIADKDFEVPFWIMWNSLQKTNVWTNVALEADDQLRQRAAWAFSQILVTSVNGASAAHDSTESWLTYYDIFVRNAFGSYRDILMEVTHSPIMGEYLSFRNSRSLDSAGNYPDENYAREIMQLFTIGLWELNQDGTRKTDANGNYVPTYTNEHIMSFARVFTGFAEQAARPNIEHFQTRNWVDPMQIIEDWHDVYPKPDLRGGYLGDGYPLCADLPPRAFLLQGAKYRFVGYTYAGTDVLALSSESALYAALAQIQIKVELNRTLQCHAEECVVSTLRVVRAAGGYYQLVQPTCVHLYFFNGRVVVPGQTERAGSIQHSSSYYAWRGTCTSPHAVAAGTACCKGCSNYFPQSMIDSGHTCENMPETLSWAIRTGCANLSGWYTENRYCQLTCWEQGVPYTGDNCTDGAIQSQNVCGYYQEKVSFESASAECERLGMHVCEQAVNGTECGHDGIDVWTPNTCTVSVEVREDGKVMFQLDSKTKQNPILVAWADGFPTLGNCSSPCSESSSGCVCPIVVETRAVFAAVPSRSELLGNAARLRIGAFPQASADCLAPCDGEVKAYVVGGSGNVTESAVFECDGVYYKNAESVVEVAGHSFRNPPVFMLAKEITGRSVRTEEVFAEVEALMDHLYYHTNLPPFLAYRLIQRMVSSNPSPTYVSAVAQAFSTGEYNGEIYSGEYGDLGATFAAILLHPEARGGLPTSSVGKLREPLIKILHFLRAMEYSDLKGRKIMLHKLEDDIGQWPFWAPSVFNYYGVEYSPSGLPDGLVAPEFEIFTPPYALTWLNGMLALVNSGGLTRCSYGIGSYPERTCNTPPGHFLIDASSNDSDANDSFTMVSLLLTGGRIKDTSAFEAALQASADGDHLKAAMRTVLMSPEFHTEGDPQPAGERPSVQEEATSQSDSYKAMVFLWFGGGLDSFNLLVPTCPDLFEEYVTVRQNVALAQGQLLEISADTQNCSTFGVHHALPFVRDLYAQGQLAFVSNVGGLVQPTTKAEYRTAPTCAGLFSHSDQTNGAMTLQCQVQGVSPKGFGGRLADVLAAQDYFTTSFSLAGSSTWSQGQGIGVEIIDGRNGAVRLQGYQELQAIVGNSTGITYGNVYSEEYARQLAVAIRSSEKLGGLLDSAQLTTSFGTVTSIARQLHQVARLIATRTERGAERDFFFVEQGGFDTHTTLDQVLQGNFAELNDALKDFVAELRGQGIFASVVLVTSSDFGRTLTSNGAGTDHGWAGNHFVLGGSINGGRIYNPFPESLLEGSLQDVGRGRLVPQYPWESVMVPIAQWLIGQTPSSRAAVGRLSSVFPNLANFNTSEHIISADSLFVGFSVTTPAPTPTLTQSPTTPSPTVAPVSTRIVSSVEGGDTEVLVESTVGFAVGDTVAIDGGGNRETRVIIEIRSSRATSSSASSGVLVLDNALTNHYPIDSIIVVYVTAAPTVAPTPVPTSVPTPPVAGPGSGGGSATGDPHLRNVHGQRFDLMKPGRHVLIQIPKGERDASTLLRVQADARRLGGCKDMYFQEINVTGSWAETKHHGGYHYAVSGQVSADTLEWVAMGKVEIKVVHGRTQSGFDYLNFYVKHLTLAGVAIGGLLGDDDHTDASSLPEGCRHGVALTNGKLALGGHDHIERSVAESNLE